MIRNFKYSALLLVGLSFTSCVEELADENKIDNRDNKMSFIAKVSGNVESRAYWEEQADGSFWFNWETSEDEMKCLVYDTENNSFKTFGDPASVYSPMKIVPTDERNVATLESLSSLNGEYSETDKVFAYSPVSTINYDEGANKATLEMALPTELNQSAFGDTRHLSPYIFMAGEGKVTGGETLINFEVMPVIVRMRINNNTSSELNIKRVALLGNLPTKANIEIEGGNETVAYVTPDSEAPIVVNNTSSEALTTGNDENLYCLFFPATLDGSDELSFYIEGADFDYIRTVSCSKLMQEGETSLAFQANHYYTFNLNVTPNGLEVLSITIDDFVPGGSSTATSSNSCWFVTPDGEGTGTSWASAGALSSVLGKANDGDVIYIKGGDYDIASQITLKYNLSIIGGYAGDEENLDNPDPEANPVNFIGGENTRCFNIANSSTESGTLKISGINFKNFNLTTANSGGVINISQGSSEVYLENLTFTDCSVLHDDANSTTGSNGGAIYINSYDGETVFNIIGCEFNNCAAKEGGAIYLNNADVATGKTLNVSDCNFIGNTSTANGGAMHLRTGNIINISNSVFSGNVASTIQEKGSGGCIYIHFNNNLNVEHCTMYENEASQKGSAICGNGNSAATQNIITIDNSIILANNATRTSSSRWALEADNIGVNNIFVINNSIVANNVNPGGKVADLAVLNASESNIITNSIVNNKYVENGIATDAPSSGSYVEYLTPEQLTELKSKVGISDSEISKYVKAE